MSQRKFEIGGKTAHDHQVMRDGIDVEALTDDFAPLTSFLNKTLRVILTFALSIFLPLVIAVITADPKAAGIEPQDKFTDAMLKLAAKYAKMEFTWGLFVGLSTTVIVVFFALKVYKFRRRHGWTTIATPYELEALFTIRPVTGLPLSNEPHHDLMDRKSALAEALLSLQTLIEDSYDEGIPKRILVTSSQPAEGKSTMAIGIAMTLARSGRKVLLIDADMRSPSIHHYLSMHNDKGLSNILAGADVTSVPTFEANGVRVLLAGPVPPNAAELLTSEDLSRVLKHWHQEMDHIVIDAPPVMGLADATRLARKCDLVLYAVEANQTWVYHALAAIKRVVNVAKVLLVVTKIPPNQFGYTYGYAYGFEYGQDQ